MAEYQLFIMKFDRTKDPVRILIICLAALIMALNIKTFVRTGGLYPGGATGLTILVQRIAERFFHLSLPYTLINVIFNAIPVYIGFRFIGKKFTLLSCFMILLTGFFTDLIPGYVITQDILLIAIFGGIINGFAMSLCLMFDATTGGTDFLAIFFSDRTGMDSFNLILLINIGILSAAGLLFGWDKALYSIIFQYVSTQIVHLLYVRYQQGTLWIITNKPHEITETIHAISNHGATVVKGKGAYENEERFVVYSVVSRADTRRVIKAVKAVDPSAFINVMRTEQIYGRFYRRPEE